MIFDYTVSVPAGTPKLTPYSFECKLTKGTLTEVRVYFPPGPATLVHVTVNDGLVQLVPANPGGTLNFDDLMIASRLEYPVNKHPYALQVAAWSPEAVYPHEITVQFDMQPLERESWTDFIAQMETMLNAG